MARLTRLFTWSDKRQRLDNKRISSWLNQPLSNVWCVVGWLLATLLFVEITRRLGGITSGDAGDSLNTTWAIAHGRLSCSYPPGNQFGLPYSAPLYPLVSGGLAALFRIGHQTTFPASAALGAHCATAVSAMYQWSLHARALETTLQLGYVGWVALMIGAVLVLRSCGRGSCRWEPLTLLLLAITPPVIMCLHEYFHPQDLLAVGLILGAVACVPRGNWVLGGIVLGLAFASQQFALLALAPLLVITPKGKLLKFITGTLGSIVVIVTPLALFAPKAAIGAALAGSGTTWTSATLLDLTRLSGPGLFFFSRFLPIVGSMVLAWWTQKHLGSRIFEPIPFLSLLASSLSLRLFFEVNLWGYYFMAVSVFILLLDILRGRLRWSFLVWLVLIMVAFHPVLGSNSSWETSSTPLAPLWAWQLILAPFATLLASSPLIETLKERASADFLSR